MSVLIIIVREGQDPTEYDWYVCASVMHMHTCEKPIRKLVTCIHDRNPYSPGIEKSQGDFCNMLH